MRRLPIHEPGSTIIQGFQYRYTEHFFKHLEKILGIKFIYLAPRLIEKENIEVRPLPSSTEKLYYCEFKYNQNNL